MNKKVNIQIEHLKSQHCPELLYSVNFTASRYGQASPCKDEADVKQATLSCQKWIQKEGDIPVVGDSRNKQMTLFDTPASEHSCLHSLKGGHKSK